MDFKFTKEQELLREEFDQFFREEMKHAPAHWGRGGFEDQYTTDEGFAFHDDMKRKLGVNGWLSRAWPKEYGGQEAPLIEQLIFNEVLAYHRAPGIDSFGLTMFAPTLMVGGSEEHKKRLLPPIAKGEVQYCQGWSEPDAGSDLANLSTTAIRDGDDYVVNGQKTWTTAGHRATHMFLLARTDPDSTRSRGLSIFHLPMDLPGIEVRPIHYMDGSHLTNDVFFKDVRISASDLIGEENYGWALTRETMNFERFGVAGFMEGKRNIEDLIAYTQSTKRNGRLISEDPIVRQKIAKLYMAHDVGQTLAYKINWEQSKGGLALAASLASESKVFGSEACQQLSNITTEVLGLHGQLEHSKWAPLQGRGPAMYQFSIAGNIYAGSSEVQRNLIAWSALGLPRM